MQKIYRKLASFGLAVAVFIGISVAVSGSTYGKYLVSDASADYYAGITAKEGDLLLGQVHDLITVTHKSYTTYVDCKTTSIIIQTDKGTADATISDFYTQENISAPWDGGTSAGTWNREHVWCQSLSGKLWGTSGGGSDLHHIRPTEVRLNSTRGNHTFGEAAGGTPAYYKGTDGRDKYIGGYVRGDTFEPLDKVKGDVARIVLYVYTHYNTYNNVNGSTNGGGNSSYFGTLKFTQIMSLNNEADAIELLMQWHNQDPVDEIETARNEAVYKIQGNRNPFIDHPEYVDAIWGDGDNNGGESGADSQNVKLFRSTVASLSVNASLNERFVSVNKAVAAYRNLTEGERAIVSGEIAVLQSAIDDYNRAANIYNSAANSASQTALGGLGFLIN